ncbi:MAG: hypothetical protein BZ137_00625 [Methanosphaera sp. rholeuAM130]|nr:MAG: hypothetical protein BZ137_00625 [Methanosphaera sp. rholeuAM130]
MFIIIKDDLILCLIYTIKIYTIHMAKYSSHNLKIKKKSINKRKIRTKRIIRQAEPDIQFNSHFPLKMRSLAVIKISYILQV